MTRSKRTKLSTLLLLLGLAWPVAHAQESAPVNSGLGASLMYELLLAEISAFNGDASAAFQLMLDAAQKDRSDQLFRRSVEIALRARAGESALQAAQAWTRLLPASREANRYQLQILVGLNKLSETVEPLKRDVAAAPPAERATTILQIPRYFVRASDKKQASRAVEQALAGELGNPSTGPAAYAAIGTMRLLAEDGAGALEAARKGAALDSHAEEPIQLALALMDGRAAAAEALVQKYLQQGAKPELHMAYVRKLLDAQRLGDAHTQVRLINATSPAYPDAWLVRGSLALQDKQLDEAQTALSTYVDLRRAEVRDGQNAANEERGLAQAYFLLADVAEQRKQPQEAERYLALIDSPQEAIRVRSRRAAMLARQGKLAEARELIRSAPETAIEDGRSKLSAEVQLLREYKQFDAVYRLLQDAVQREPADVDLRYDLAMAAERLDRMEEAEVLLRQVIADKPDYHHAYNALGYSLADRNQRLPEARALILKALQLAPEDPFIQDSLGWVEFRSGHLDEALRILQAAYQNRQDAEIAAHLGEVLWRMGQREQARSLWKNSLLQSPDSDALRDTIKRLDSL